MKEVKNLCPIGFFWRGYGVGFVLMVVGLVGIVVVILAKLAALALWNENMLERIYPALSLA